MKINKHTRPKKSILNYNSLILKKSYIRQFLYQGLPSDKNKSSINKSFFFFLPKFINKYHTVRRTKQSLTKSLSFLCLVNILLGVDNACVPKQLQVVVHVVGLLQRHSFVLLAHPVPCLHFIHLSHFEHATALAGRSRGSSILPENAAW